MDNLAKLRNILILEQMLMSDVMEPPFYILQL